MTELPLPRDMPGFAAAVSAGLTPARPAERPAVRQPTSHQAMVRLGLTLALWTAVFLASLFVPPVPHRLGNATALVAAMVVTAGFFVSRAALVRFRTTFLQELQAGYVTHTFVQALFWRNGGGDADVIGWEWKGLWTLTSDGRVVSAPDPSVDPPGVYPSPNAPGRRELWTGCQWANVFFDGGHR